MAYCAYCKSETELFDGGVPICIECCSGARDAKRKPEKDIRTVLVNAIIEATARVNEANQEFNVVVGQFPTGLPHPDGVQRIRDASNELSVARKEMMTAHKRLNDFIETHVVPKDLAWH